MKTKLRRFATSTARLASGGFAREISQRQFGVHTLNKKTGTFQPRLLEF
jgi:hypothetical protein